MKNDMKNKYDECVLFMEIQIKSTTDWVSIDYYYY